MSEEKRRPEPQRLRALVPISELTQENFGELLSKTFVEQLPAGRTVFKKGERDNWSYYLLSGEVVLNDGKESRSIAGGTSKARFPLDHHRPHLATGTAVTPVEFVRIDNDLLDVLLTWDQNNAGYLVSEIGEDDPDGDTHWMVTLLRSSIFTRIPPSNIHAMFMRLEPMPVRAGDSVVRQGDVGDYYYYVRQGRAVVTRTGKNGQPIKLAELTQGSSFGEEALISGGKRNATIQMISDGLIMRLSKADFDVLLKEPVLRSVSFDMARRIAREGALWLDVRLESEHRNNGLPGSLNLPLYLLRLKAPELDKSRNYLVYCDTGRRSACAAYLLSERGFNAYVLSGGLMEVAQAARAASKGG